MIALSAAASAKAAAPIASSIHLNGAYACTGTEKNYSMATTWSPVLAGTWLLDEDADVDNFVTHDAKAHVWRVASLDKRGEVMVLEAPDTSASHIVFKAVYPANAKQTTIYDRVSATQYKVTFDGRDGGKSFHEVVSCTKK